MVVFFDLDDTLLDYTSAVRTAAGLFWADHLRLFAEMSLEMFVQRWEALASAYGQLAGQGKMSWTDQRRRRMRDLFAMAGRALTDAQVDAEFNRYFAYYKSNWRAFPDVAPCLDALAGHPLGVISNGEAGQQQRKLEALAIRDRFDPVIVSAEIGLAKPDPEIFLYACQMAGAAPGDCLFVGDQLDSDARAGAAAGMKGVWLDRGRRALPPGDVEMIHTLSDLPALVEEGP